MMEWLERLFSDTVEVADKFNRKRLINQRKWALLFYVVGLTVELRFVRVNGEFLVFNFSTMDPTFLSNSAYLAGFIVGVFSCIQFPAFVANYNQYINYAFMHHRHAERNKLAEKIDELEVQRSNLEEEYRSTSSSFYRIEQVFEELAASDGNSPTQQQIYAEFSREFGIANSENITESLRRRQNDLRYSQSNQAAKIRNVEDLTAEARDELVWFDSRLSGEKVVFRMTEIATDFTRVAPVFVLSFLCALKLFEL